MKRLVILSLAVSLSVAISYAQGIVWENGTLKEALSKAASGNNGRNLVFLDCYTQWCGPCKMMLNNVFPTKEAGDYFNAKFINVKMDMEAGEGPEWGNKFGIRAYPTFLILRPDGTEVTRIVGGASSAESFIAKVNKALDPANSPEYHLTQYEQTKDIDNLFKYFAELKNQYMDSAIARYISQNYDNLPQGIATTRKFWDYILISIGIEDITVLNKVLANKYAYDLMIGKEKVDADIYKKLKRDISEYIYLEKDVPVGNIGRACEFMSMYKTDDAYDMALMKLAKAYCNKDYAGIGSMFDGKSLSYSYTAPECSMIINLVKMIKGVSDADKERLVMDYRESLLKTAENLDKQNNR